MERRKKREQLKENMRNLKCKTMKVMAAAYAIGMCSVGYVLPVYASNPMSNARNVVNEWLQPLFFIGIGVFGILLLLKRKFTEFFSFIFVALIACALIFFPENIKNFLGEVIIRLFP